MRTACFQTKKVFVNYFCGFGKSEKSRGIFNKHIKTGRPHNGMLRHSFGGVVILLSTQHVIAPT